MAITAVLVNATPNGLRYLLTQDGQAGTAFELPNAGGASPDFRTDSNDQGNPIRQFARAGFDGIGPLAAGTFTQAQIRAFLLADDPTNAVLSNRNVPRCKAFITPRGAGNFDWSVDAGAAATSPVNRSDPTYAVRSGAAAGDAYLDIVFQSTPGM